MFGTRPVEQQVPSRIDQSQANPDFLANYRCPVDNSIFPSFAETGNALESTYEAFRFTESYGVIFQCNVKYCIGKCEPVSIVIARFHSFLLFIQLLICYLRALIRS